MFKKIDPEIRKMREEMIATISKKQTKKERLRCQARTSTGDQCLRRRAEQGDYCSGHAKHCPYGKISGPIEGKLMSIPKKRGPKTAKNYSLEELDPELYQETSLIKIDQSLYLIDDQGLLFKNDDSCEIVGRKVPGEIHWYN